MKFTEGDRVKLSQNTVFGGGELYEAPVGTTGTIVETVQYPVYGVKLDDGMPGQTLSGYHEDELEPAA